MSFITEKFILADVVWELSQRCLADTGPSTDLTQSARYRAAAHRGRDDVLYLGRLPPKGDPGQAEPSALGFAPTHQTCPLLHLHPQR